MASRKQLVDRWKVEPGAMIQRRVGDWVREQAARQWATPDAAALYGLLVGLPLRDEVPGGRDLRGSSFAGARNLDLAGADLSYCGQLGSLDACDLRGAKLDGAKLSFSLKGQFVEARFVGARLVGTYAQGSTFARCDFAGANLKNLHWAGADLRGSSFVDANLEGADLQRCDVRGCDFRRAKLDRAMFRQVTLDATTDLRGASLRGLVHDDHRDNAGTLVLRGTDWRQATWDASTQSADAPGAADAAIVAAVVKAARRERAAWAARLAEHAAAVQRSVAADAAVDWLEALLAPFAPAERAEIEPFIQQATLSFGEPE
jgi:uncharacterized protein YjbI with pentapeptide repeats